MSLIGRGRRRSIRTAWPTLEEERTFLLRSLRDLDAEHAAGDVDEHDYTTLRDGYTKRAADVHARDRRRPGPPAGRRPATLVAAPRDRRGGRRRGGRRRRPRRPLVGRPAGGRGDHRRRAGRRRRLDARRSPRGRRRPTRSPRWSSTTRSSSCGPDHAEALTYSGWLLLVVGAAVERRGRRRRRGRRGPRAARPRRSTPTPPTPIRTATSAIIAAELDGDVERARARPTPASRSILRPTCAPRPRPTSPNSTDALASECFGDRQVALRAQTLGCGTSDQSGGGGSTAAGEQQFTAGATSVVVAAVEHPQRRLAPVGCGGQLHPASNERLDEFGNDVAVAAEHGPIRDVTDDGEDGLEWRILGEPFVDLDLESEAVGERLDGLDAAQRRRRDQAPTRPRVRGGRRGPRPGAAALRRRPFLVGALPAGADRRP